MGVMGVTKNYFKEGVGFRMGKKDCYDCKYGATSVNLCIKHMSEIPKSENCDYWKYFDLERELKWNMEN